MKKLIIQILIGLYSFVSIYGQIGGSVKIDPANLRIENIGEFSKIYLENSSISGVVVGEPELPTYVESFVVPEEASIKGIKINNIKKQRIDGTFMVYPTQPPISVTSEDYLQEFISPDKSIYNSTLPYPGKYSEIISDQYEHGYRIITVRIFPIEYIPQKGEIYLCNINFEIEYDIKMQKSISTKSSKSSERIQELRKHHIQSIVKNKEDVLAFTSKTEEITQELDKETLFITDSPIMLTGQVTSTLSQLAPEYIIITNNALKSTFQELADWKTKKGIFTIIKTVEEIDESFSGCDMQEKIRNYLIKVNSIWGSSLFILLGGDTNIIPARIVVGQKGIMKPSDLYYATVNGTWNANKNNVFGESGDVIDYGYAFYLGRAPVENIQEAKVFVNKVLSYEKKSNVSNVSYYNNFLIADAFIGKNSLGVYYDIAKYSLKSLMNNITVNYQNIKPYYLFDDVGCSGNSIYDYDYEEPCVLGNEELNKNNFLSALNNGSHSGLGYFHFIYHMDHSAERTMGASSLNKGNSISNYDFDNLSNGNHFQIMMSGGCKPATFTQDCIAERYLKNPNNGGVAFIGNADVGYSGEYRQFKYLMNSIFNQNSSKRYDLGYAFQKAPNDDSWPGTNSQRRRLTLLGDPEMQIWTATPKTLTISPPPIVLYTGSNTLNVTINNLPTGEEAMICIRKGEEVYDRKIVTQNGTSTFTFSTHTVDTLDLTVTAHNFTPYEKRIPVKAKTSAPNLYISSYTMNDYSSGNVIGNSNGVIDAGEKVELTIQLKNTGQITANSVKAQLISNSTDIVADSTQISFGNIAYNGTQNSTAKFVITVNKDAEEQLRRNMNPARLALQITDNAGRAYTDYLDLDIYAPKIEQGNKIITATSNGNKTIEAGETVYMNIDLTNIGKGVATGLTAVLTADNCPYITSCLSSTRIYPNIFNNQTQTPSSAFYFTVSNMYTNSSLPLKFKLLVKNKYGREWTFYFNLANRPDKILSDSIETTSSANEIELSWNVSVQNPAYNIYRCKTDVNGNPTGTYTKMNNFPVTSRYFRDYGLSTLTRYYYKVSAISDDGIESELSDPVLACTSYGVKERFPVEMESQYSKSMGSVNAIDVDFDGKKEIFTVFQTNDNSNEGIVAALNHEGNVLYDTDWNVTTNNGFVHYNAMVRGTPAIGDLYGIGEYQLVAATRGESPSPNWITCLSFTDNDLDKKPDVIWEKTGIDAYTYLRGPVIGNLSNNKDGSKNVLLQSCGWSPNKGIQIFDALGNKQETDFGQNTLGGIAIADLDGDGDKEVIVGKTDGVYAWHHNGSPFSPNKLYSHSSYDFASSSVVCDLDNDGQKEVLIHVKKKTGIGSALFAIKANGTLVSGWNGSQTFASDYGGRGISVGNLNNDGKLEVVALCKDSLKVWNNQGQIILAKKVLGIGQFADNQAPILADVDGDPEIEIIFGSGIDNKVYAYNLDGTMAQGFPLNTEGNSNFFYNSVCVADIDNNGKNEVIASIVNKVYVWETDGLSSRIEWGSQRHDPQNTGEYFKICDPKIITANTTWTSNQTFCGDLIIHTGTLTINATSTVTMDPGSMIIIKKGAKLIINGGKIMNANLKAISGSTVILQNDAYVKLSRKGEFNIMGGASFEYIKGNIDVTP